MSDESPQDIREWLRASGYDVADRGRIAAEQRAAFEAARSNSTTPPPADDEDDDQDDVFVVDMPQPPPGGPQPRRLESVKDDTPAAEKPPQPPSRPRRGLFGGKPRDKARPRKRVSIENIVSSGWGLAAMALLRKPQSVPVARVLQMQAPVAGVIVDDLAKGTVIDRVLQPLARAGEKGETAFALIGPPVLVGAMTARPDLWPVLKPMLRMSLMSWAEISGPAMAAAERRAKKLAGSQDAADIDAMIDALFAIDTVPSEQEEENIRRARGQ